MPFGFNYQDPRATVAADNDPNTTAPAEDRIFRSPLAQGSKSGGTLGAYVLLADGTSLDATFWVRLPHSGGPTWIQLAAASSITALLAVLVTDVPPDADLFLQVTNPVGGPTVLGVAFV